MPLPAPPADFSAREALLRRTRLGGRRNRARLERDRQERAAGPEQRLRAVDSELRLGLLQDWAWGFISAARLSSRALKAWRDEQALLARFGHAGELGSRSLRTFAQLGTFGKFTRKAHGDLLEILGEPTAPKPTTVELPVKVVKLGRSPVRRPPHLATRPLDYWYTQNQLKDVLGPTCSPEMFWAAVQKTGDPRLLDHPMLQRPGWKERGVPYAIHGDAVPVTAVGKSGTRSCDVVSIQSLLSVGSSIDVKHVAFVTFLDNVAKPTANDADTMGEAWKIITWSLWFAYLGIWPTCDWDGQPWGDDRVSEKAVAGTWLAQGNFIVPWLLKGDLDYFAKNLHLRNYNANKPCDFCGCDKSKLFEWWPSNFTARAAWKRNLFDKAQWQALYPEGGGADARQ